MSTIRNLHDTFLRMLADTLPALTFKEIRYDANDATAPVLQTNCVNITFINRSFDIQPSPVLVLIDVCHNNQLTAMDWEEQLGLLLQKAAFTPLLDYSVPASPVPMSPSKNIFWQSKVSFRPVVADSYYHSTATVTLNHT